MQTLIRPSAAIRQNYTEIAALCKETGEPVFLTKNGEGDLVVMDTENGRVAVFEAKYSKMFQQLESDCNKAINQIESRMYAREFEENGDDVFCYGIAFFKKRCCVKIKS